MVNQERRRQQEVQRLIAVNLVLRVLRHPLSRGDGLAVALSYQPIVKKIRANLTAQVRHERTSSQKAYQTTDHTTSP
jgi:hypothetical protein